MAIKVKILKKSSPNKPKEEMKYYAAAVYGETINDEALIKKMTDICSVNDIDITTTLMALSRVVQQEIKQGCNIKIKGLGTFYPTIKSEGTTNLRKANKSLIKEVSAGFRPSSELKTALANAEFDKVQ